MISIFFELNLYGDLSIKSVQPDWI